MEIELKGGKWQTKDGLFFNDLSDIDKDFFSVMISVEIIMNKYKAKNLKLMNNYNEERKQEIFEMKIKAIKIIVWLCLSAIICLTIRAIFAYKIK